MAAKAKSSKAAKKQAPQQSATPAKNPPLTLEQKAAKFDELMASYDEAAKSRKGAAKSKPKFLKLSEREAEKIGWAINSLASKFASIHRIAWHMGEADHTDSDAAATAIDALSELGAMEADAITRSIGQMEAGFFADKVAFLTRGRAKQ